MIKEVAEKMSHNGIELIVPKSVRKYLVQKGYDPKTGARNLRRIIQREIEDNIAEKILKDKSNEKVVMKAGLKNGAVYFKTSISESEESSDREETGSALKI